MYKNSTGLINHSNLNSLILRKLSNKSMISLANIVIRLINSLSGWQGFVIQEN